MPVTIEKIYPQDTSIVFTIYEARKVVPTNKIIAVKQGNVVHYYMYDSTISSDKLDEENGLLIEIARDSSLGGGWLLIGNNIRAVSTINEIKDGQKENIYYWNGLFYKYTTEAPASDQYPFYIPSNIYSGGWKAFNSGPIFAVFYADASAGDDANPGTRAQPIKSVLGIINKFDNKTILPFLNVKVFGTRYPTEDKKLIIKDDTILAGVSNIMFNEFEAYGLDLEEPTHEPITIEARAIRLYNSRPIIADTGTSVYNTQPFFKAIDEIYIHDPSHDWGHGSYGGVDVLPRYIAEINTSTKIYVKIGGITSRNTQTPGSAWSFFRGYSKNIQTIDLGTVSGNVFYWSDYENPARLSQNRDIHYSTTSALPSIKPDVLLLLRRKKNEIPYAVNYVPNIYLEETGELYKSFPVDAGMVSDTDILTILETYGSNYLKPEQITDRVGIVFIKENANFEITLNAGASTYFITPEEAVIQVLEVRYENTHFIEFDTIYSAGTRLFGIKILPFISASANIEFSLDFSSSDTKFDNYKTEYVPEQPVEPGISFVPKTSSNNYVTLLEARLARDTLTWRLGPHAHPNSIIIPPDIRQEYWRIKNHSGTSYVNNIGIAYINRRVFESREHRLELENNNTYMKWKLTNDSPTTKTFLIKIST